MQKFVERFNKSWNADENDLLIKLRNQGLSHREISNIMKRSEHAIMCRLSILKNYPSKNNPLKVSATETIEPPFDVTMEGKYEDMQGRPARIYAVDGPAPYCVHGALFIDEKWMFFSWTINGQAHKGPKFDLKHIKPKLKRDLWLWVSQDRALACISKETAQQKVELDGGLAILVNIDHEIGIVHG